MQSTSCITGRSTTMCKLVPVFHVLPKRWSPIAEYLLHLGTASAVLQMYAPFLTIMKENHGYESRLTSYHLDVYVRITVTNAHKTQLFKYPTVINHYFVESKPCYSLPKIYRFLSAVIPRYSLGLRSCNLSRIVNLRITRPHVGRRGVNVAEAYKETKFVTKMS